MRRLILGRTMENGFGLYCRSSAEEKALLLLKSVLSDDQWDGLERRGVIVFNGQRNVYVLSPTSQTEIHDKTNGRLVARACLQLTVPAPGSDRLIAEYLILKNDEDLYWRTANIFSKIEWDIAVPMLILGDMILLINLIAKLACSR
jgi:hypothetical protein